MEEVRRVVVLVVVLDKKWHFNRGQKRGQVPSSCRSIRRTHNWSDLIQRRWLENVHELTRKSPATLGSASGGAIAFNISFFHCRACRCLCLVGRHEGIIIDPTTES